MTYEITVQISKDEAQALSKYMRRLHFTNLDFYNLKNHEIEALRRAFDAIRIEINTVHGEELMFS